MNAHDEASVNPAEALPGTRAETPMAPSSGAPVKKGQSLELEIENLAFGGKALAKVGGFVVFVENALPGDRVIATVFK
jgi:predicted RNA-binding protein with TRAM domain